MSLKTEPEGWKKEFEELVFPMLNSLYSTALRMTGENSRAEDLVQDTVLKAYRNFHRFEKGSNLKAWIYTILTNTYINEYRRRRKEPASYDFAEVEPGAPEEDSPRFSVEDVEALKEKLGDEAARSLDKLPPEFRLVFLLSTFENFRYKEISEIVGVPIGTVMSRLFRARKILRDELAGYARQSGYLKGEPGS